MVIDEKMPEDDDPSFDVERFRSITVDLELCREYGVTAGIVASLIGTLASANKRMKYDRFLRNGRYYCALSASRIAAILGISKSAVHEALRKLKADGVVLMERIYRGYAIYTVNSDKAVTFTPTTFRYGSGMKKDTAKYFFLYKEKVNMKKCSKVPEDMWSKESIQAWVKRVKKIRPE